MKSELGRKTRWWTLSTEAEREDGAVDEDAEAVLPLGEPDGPRQVLGPRRALCHAEQVRKMYGRGLVNN